MSVPHNSKRLSFLFLGGAKRVAMARMLKEACAAAGYECRITGYELSAHSALAQEGTIVEGLRWSDPTIFADLDRVCRENEVDVVLPFVDAAVGIAAEFVVEHSSTGVFAPVGTRAEVERMFDKCAAAALFEQLQLPIPATYRSGMPATKLIAKPRYGSASKGIIEIDTPEELAALQHADDYLIQERIDRRQEITVDCYVGVRSGEIVAVSPRLRIEVSGGEAVRTITIDDDEATALARKVLQATGMRGAVTVQLLRDLDSGRLMVMEINPRLGGGAVASVHAGVNLPCLIIDDALGLPLKHQQATAGVETVRYLADVVFYPDK